MKTSAIRLFTLCLSVVLLAGCVATQHSVSLQESVCVDFTEKSVGYAVEVMSAPSETDPIISLQLVKKHSHQLADLNGQEVSTYINTANRQALTTTLFSLILAGLGVAIGMLIFVWIGGLGALVAWIIAFVNPDYSVPVSKGYLVETKQSVLLDAKSCPITYLYPAEKTFILTCNGIPKEVKSDSTGRITFNFINEFDFRGREMPSELTLGIRSEELNIRDSFPMRNLRTSLPRGPGPSANNPYLETPSQYLVAEQIYWKIDSKNSPGELARGTYYLPNEADRKATMDKIGNQRLMRILIKKVSDLDERKLIFSKLNNESLVCLSRLADDQGVALACLLKTNQANWPVIFRNKSKTSAELRNIVRAAALIDSPLPGASDIVGVCHRYILMGDESSVPELISLLMRFGDKTLAEDYLNCGNGRLSEAAGAWGRAHGLNVKTGAGSHRVQWGGGR